MRIRRIFPAAALALALGVSGCGSDEPDSTDDARTSSETTTEKPETSATAGSGESGAGESEPPDEAGSDDMSSDDERQDGEGQDDEGKDETAQTAGPDFTGTTLEGERFDGASLAGKPAVLWFWPPWCPKCIAQAPAVLDVAAEHEGEVNFVGVAGLADASEMPEFVEKTDTGALTHLSDPEGEIWRKYDVAEQSSFVLLDSTGEPVTSGRLSDDELAARVAELQ